MKLTAHQREYFLSHFNKCIRVLDERLCWYRDCLLETMEKHDFNRKYGDSFFQEVSLQAFFRYIQVFHDDFIELVKNSQEANLIINDVNEGNYDNGEDLVLV